MIIHLLLFKRILSAIANKKAHHVETLVNLTDKKESAKIPQDIVLGKNAVSLTVLTRILNNLNVHVLLTKNSVLHVN